MLFQSLILFYAAVQGALAQSTLSSSISELPSCALICLETTLENSTCLVTNTTCICTDVSFQKKVTQCVTESCTIPQGLLTKNITETTCGSPVRDKSVSFNVVSNTFAALSGAAILLRVISKIATRVEFGLDDYSIFIAFASGIPSSVLGVHGLISNGLGRDIWTVLPQQITHYLRSFYVMEILYFTQVFLLKLSLLFFYLRIFPAPKFRKFLWATVIFDVVYGVLFTSIAIFQCQPISYYWYQWDGEHKGRCINVNGVGWSNAIISILLDIWMLGLAVSQLLHLQMHWKKKVGVGMMFATGIFVTIVSILRLQSLLQFANSTNPTWDNFAVTMWSTVEINVGIICACMPSMRILLVRLFPKIMGTTRNISSNKQYGNNSHNRFAANVSVDRGKDLPPTPMAKNTIMYSQTYNVDIEDETHLVPMNDLQTIRHKSSSLGSSIGE